MNKRIWRVIVPGRAPFIRILMDDTEDALEVARSIWPGARVE
ncbi:hypothetical protein [Escherichia coli]